MAVAVKTSSGARSSGTTGWLAVYSLFGVIYLLATLAIVFKLLPGLWWSAWEGVHLAPSSIVGAVSLALVEVAVGVGLIWGGARLLGKRKRL